MMSLRLHDQTISRSIFPMRAAFTLALVAVSVMPVSAFAATFTVNSTTDAVDAVPGDGSCETALSGECTLRAAIQEANALVGPDAIGLPAGSYVLTLAGDGEQAGDLDVTGDLDISGVGPESTIVDGGGIDRVFLIGTVPTPEPPPPPEPPGLPVAISSLSDANIVVTLAGLSVINGRTDVPPGPKNGGGIFSQYANVTLNNVTVANNTAGVDGGGIYNTFGSMTIINSNLKNNEARGALGGGAIQNALAGELAVIASTIVGNKASSPLEAPGGGISNEQSGSLLTVLNSTISGNFAGGGGGAIFSASPTALVKSSTLTANTALGGAGALAGNFALDLDNTVIAGNLPSNCVEFSGVVRSLGNNLDSDGSCGLSAPGDLANVDPLLGPLQDNGGATATHALLAGSPAIDAGPAACTDAAGAPLLTDQRGAPRPSDGNGDGIAACDIGAYEVQAGLIAVDIDIRPGSRRNVVNPGSQGVIRVAVLSDNVFDPLQIDTATVRFGPAGAQAVQHRVRDVNRDGLADLLLSFKIRQTGIGCTDTEATLTGETFGGQGITGSDAILTVGCKKK